MCLCVTSINCKHISATARVPAPAGAGSGFNGRGGGAQLPEAPHHILRPHAQLAAQRLVLQGGTMVASLIGCRIALLIGNSVMINGTHISLTARRDSCHSLLHDFVIGRQASLPRHASHFLPM